MIGVFAKLVAVCSCCCLSAVDVSAIWMMVAGFAVCDRGVVEFNNDSAVSSVMMTSSVIGSLPLESLFSSVLVFVILVCITFGFCWFVGFCWEVFVLLLLLCLYPLMRRLHISLL